MDVDVVTRLRRVLAPTGWPAQARAVAGALAEETVMARGLVVVGTGPDSPAHLADHLDDVARRRGDDRLAPRLVAAGGSLAAVRDAAAGESVLVVASRPVGTELARALERARAQDACVASIDVGHDPVLADLAVARLVLRQVGAATWLPDPLQRRAGPAPVDALPRDVAEHLVASVLLHRDEPEPLIARVLTTLGL